MKIAAQQRNNFQPQTRLQRLNWDKSLEYILTDEEITASYLNVKS